jgi:hypothetical protein
VYFEHGDTATSWSLIWTRLACWPRSSTSEDARRWQILRAIGRALDRLQPADIAASSCRGTSRAGGVLTTPAGATAHLI